MEKHVLIDTDIPGWSSRNELALLGSLASRVPNNGTIVELGSFAGRTAAILAKNAPHAKVYCIDPWGYFDLRMVPEDSLVFMSGNLSSFHPGELYEVFLRNVQDCPNIIPLRGLSTDVEWKDQAPIDLLFVDADHDTDPLFNDLRTWWPRMHPDGSVVGHDWQMRTVRDACINFLESINAEKDYPQLLNFPTVSIWGLLKGIRHAAKWGMDFSAIYPYGEDGWDQLRPLEEVRSQREAAVENAPSLKD
jgi:hypothetical protein